MFILKIKESQWEQWEQKVERGLCLSLASYSPGEFLGTQLVTFQLKPEPLSALVTQSKIIIIATQKPLTWSIWESWGPKKWSTLSDVIQWESGRT